MIGGQRGAEDISKDDISLDVEMLMVIALDTSALTVNVGNSRKALLFLQSYPQLIYFMW